MNQLPPLTEEQKKNALRAQLSNSQKAMQDFKEMIPHNVILPLEMKTQATVQDYLIHGEGGRLALIHLALTVAMMIEQDQF